MKEAAASRRARQGGDPATVSVRELWRRQPPLLAGDGVEHGKLKLLGIVEEDAAVPGFDRDPAGGAGAAGVGRAEGRDRAEAGGAVLGPVEEAEHVRGPVELEEPAVETAVGDEAAPGPADERRAEERRGVVWRETEEDLLDEVVH